MGEQLLSGTSSPTTSALPAALIRIVFALKLWPEGVESYDTNQVHSGMLGRSAPRIESASLLPQEPHKTRAIGALETKKTGLDIAPCNH
jgi:hypothetical protein